MLAACVLLNTSAITRKIGFTPKSINEQGLIIHGGARIAVTTGATLSLI
jgi:hypothetical protein